MAQRTRRRSGAERREQIAEAALDLLGEGGPGALTTSRLADAVALTPGALFRHYPTLEAVLAGAVTRAVTAVEATLPPADLPPLERLGALARARIDLLQREPGIAWLLRSGQAQGALPPGAVADLAGLVRRSRATIRTALAEAAELGVARADVPTDVLLLIFTATVHTLVGRTGARGGDSPAPAAEAAVRGLLTLLTPTASHPEGTPRC